MRALVLAAATFVCHAAFAANSTSVQRYSLSGSGALRLDAPAQTGAGLRLKATLQEKDAALAAMPPVQEDGRFALIAALTSAPSVCYNDTIFRDDFDGDGF